MVELFTAGLMGIITCAPGVPGSIIQGSPFPSSAASRWLAVETPTDSGVRFGSDITQSRWIRSRLSYPR
jgi:hypothetical protein